MDAELERVLLKILAEAFGLLKDEEENARIARYIVRTVSNPFNGTIGIVCRETLNQLATLLRDYYLAE